MPALRFRRKPEEVEAFYYTGDPEQVEAILEWAAGRKMRWNTKKADREAPILGDESEMHISEGVGKERDVVAIAVPGQFIVKGADGLFRAVGYNEFIASYDPA